MVIAQKGEQSYKKLHESVAFFVRKSVKSFNSEIGVSLTILGCGNAWTNPFIWLKNIFSGLKRGGGT